MARLATAATLCALHAQAQGETLERAFVLEFARHGHRLGFKEAGTFDPSLTAIGWRDTYKVGLQRRQ